MSERTIVADAGPLIGLARVDRLEFLRQLYREIVIPPQVEEELRLAEERPRSLRLRAAVAEGWLQTRSVDAAKAVPETLGLDAGEAAAIALALELQARFLLIDEQRGRRAASRAGVAVVGVPGILLAAKLQVLVPQVLPTLDALAAAGYRLSAELRVKVLQRAGEL